MKREIESKLKNWKSSKRRKPLVMMGARQVGKTWLMQEFGKHNFARTHYFSFDAQKSLASLFNDNIDPKDLMLKLSALSDSKIDTKNDLVIFDEIQECPNALNSLKYFQENCPELAVMAAGSLLGVRLSGRRGEKSKSEAPARSYPVGKVELLDMEPMNFAEFLREYDERLCSFYMGISGREEIPEIFHKKLLDVYDLYLFTGGMPEVVSEYLENHDPQVARKQQRDLIALYEDDVVKYNGEVDAAKILAVLRSVVPQLAKANEKFVYGALRNGARAREYENAIEWLVSARMIRRVNNLAAMRFPLAAYEERSAFKIYHLDVGLLREAAGIPQSQLATNASFDFKGPLVENYVLQQLFGHGEGKAYYYSERSNKEIDFVLQLGSDIAPIEVKAGTDKLSPSFKSYVSVNQPKYAVRFSRRNLCKDGGFVNIPLYLASKFEECFK